MADPPLGIDRIQGLLPHRYPMLMLDRVIEIGPESITAEKLVTVNEPFFEGHFPGRPIMPGVLIIEAMAQAGGLMIIHERPELRGRGVAIVGIEKARFRRPVVPGDVLRIDATMSRTRGDLVWIRAFARVRGTTAAEAEVMAAFVDWEQPA